MKAKNPDETLEAPASAEVRHLMDLLRTLARALGYSNAALARQSDVALASLVRYFKGDAEPRLDFVLAVLRGIGLDVREFFEMAYPERETPTAARRSLDRILGPIRPGKLLESPPVREPEPKPEIVPLRREDVEKMLDDLRRDVRVLLADHAGKPAAPEPVKPSSPRKKNGDG
jgi:DNA-binding phage protein